MNKIVDKMQKLFVFVLLCFSLNAMSQSLKTTQNMTKVDGEYKIKYQERYYDVDTTTVTIKCKDSNARYMSNYVLKYNKLGFACIQKPSNISLEDFIELLSIDETVESIIYNTYGEYAAFQPNDADPNLQWHLWAVKALEAWDITTGSPNIIVAILDSGVDWMHPDLGLGSDNYQNIYLNPGEDTWAKQDNPTTGNHLDDDNNGFIDDWKGWHFVNNSNDSRDLYYHGTFVAGLLGAKTDNNQGVAGIAGGKNGEGVKLLAYNIGDYAPSSSALVDAIVAAVDNGAKIIQLSVNVAPSLDIEEAIQYATENNVVVVCASGNQYASTVVFPASNPNVIAVGATDRDNYRADFYNYGDDLDVVAPGVDLYSTNLNNGYKIDGGTSFAAPIVSGVCALLLSINPNLTRQQVRYIIESTCQKVNPYLPANPSGYDYQIESDRPNGTWNIEMGYGLIDANAAVVKTLCHSDLPIIQGTITQNTTWNTNVHAIGTITIPRGVTLTIKGTIYRTSLTEFIIQSPGGKLVFDDMVYIDDYCPNMLFSVGCVSASFDKIKIEWDNVVNATNYIVRYSLDSDFSSIIGTHTLNNTTTMTFTGLIPQTIYYFRVEAYNSVERLGIGTTNCTTIDSIFYVKKGGAGTQDGSSWANAHPEVASSLQIVSTNLDIKQIWVADGIYYPTTTTDRAIPFTLPSNVLIYGGFPANANDINHTSINNRNFSAGYNTVLSGDIGIANNVTDNSYTVVFAGGYSHLDGFAVTGGYADGEQGAGILATDYAELRNLSVLKNYGDSAGGIAILGGSPRLEQIHVYQNSAGVAGGLAVMDGNPELNQIYVYENAAETVGGGIAVMGGNPYFENSYIYQDSAEFGGGVAIIGGNPHFEQIYAYENSAEFGGGIALLGGNPYLEQIYVYENIAFSGGGMAIISGGCPHLEEIYAYENHANHRGGGIFCSNTNLYAKQVDIFENSAVFGGGFFCESNTLNTIPIFENIRIARNNAANEGGGIYNAHAGSVFLNALIYDNAGAAGATIYNTPSASILFVHSTITKTIPTMLPEIIVQDSNFHAFNSIICLNGFTPPAGNIGNHGICRNYFNDPSNGNDTLSSPPAGNRTDNDTCLDYFNDPFRENYTLRSALLTTPVDVYSIIQNIYYPNGLFLRPCLLLFDLLATDLSGNPRVTNGQSSFGAYEYGSSPYWKSMSGNEKQELQKPVFQADSDEKLHIYPNPTNDIVTINSEQVAINRVEVFDVVGRKLMWILDINNSQTTLNIESLEKGIYFIKVVMQDGMQQTKKMVKQ